MKKNSGKSTFITLNALIQKFSLQKIKQIMYYVDRVLSIPIKNSKYEDDGKKKIAIIYNLALGDGTIFRASLKEFLKDYNNNEYSVTLFCQKGLKNIYTEIYKFDNIVELDFNSATVNLKERYKNIKIIKSKYYDTLFDPVGANECFTNVLMSRCLLAKEKIGCIISNKKTICPKHILKKTYTNIKYLNEKSLIGQYFEYFDKSNIHFLKFKGTKPSIELPKEYYIVFPSASTDLKKWPIERYAKIIRKIYKKTGLTLLLCGTNTDKKDYDKLTNLIKDVPKVNITGKTSLLEFIYVISNAKFVVTNDTSTYHIAVTNEIPVAIITGGYTYDRYVEYNFKGSDKYKKPYIIVNKMPCFNCENKCSKINAGDKIWPCLDAIDVEYAWKIIEKMIDEL